MLFPKMSENQEAEYQFLNVGDSFSCSHLNTTLTPWEQLKVRHEALILMVVGPPGSPSWVGDFKQPTAAGS